MDDRETGTTSSRSATEPSSKRLGLRKTSIQTEVSTKNMVAYRRGRTVAAASPLISERSPSHKPEPASSRIRPAR